MLNALFAGAAASTARPGNDVESAALLPSHQQSSSSAEGSLLRNDVGEARERKTPAESKGPAGGDAAAASLGLPPLPAPAPTKVALQPLSSSGAPGWVMPAVYGLTNLSSVVTIVFANKMALGKMGFAFPVALTWLHTIFTAVGMIALASLGTFAVKKVPLQKSLPMACVYVGFIVFNNLSIRYNPVGFYQISKIAITPVVVLIEYFAYRKSVSRRILASIVVLLSGIGLATVTDSEVSSNFIGLVVAALNIFVTSLYQVWAGTKQKELGLNGMQLLHQVAPSAVMLLGVLIPAMEPLGLRNPSRGTILGYEWSGPAAFWVLFSSVLGLVVTLSTFLFIGVTSSLTYNVVGHLKTVCIVSGGVFIFGESMNAQKFAGISLAMSGIIWYSQIKMQETKKPA